MLYHKFTRIISHLLLSTLFLSSYCSGTNKSAVKKFKTTTPVGKLVLGTIQFPPSLHKIPMVRIYYGGHKITPSLNDETKQITFGVPKGMNQTSLYLLITEAVNCNIAKNNHYTSNIMNTIGYLKASPNKPYRLFKLAINEQASGWGVDECMLTTDDLRIPDMAIVVHYNPNFIDTIQPTKNNFALPVINLKQNLLELAGSEDKLHDISNALLLASIDIDTIHATLSDSIKIEANRALIAAPTV